MACKRSIYLIGFLFLSRIKALMIAVCKVMYHWPTEGNEKPKAPLQSP